MRLTWREQLYRNPQYSYYENWPIIDTYSIDIKNRRGFKKRQLIVRRVLSGMPSSEAARLSNVSKSFVSYLMERVLGSVDGELPALSAGLIPNQQLIKPSRKMTLTNGKSKGHGARCAFQDSLKQNPWVVEELDNRLIAYINRKGNYENLTVTRFHRLYLELLRRANWPSTNYPFDQDKEGYESCRKYFHKRIKQLRIPKVKIKEPQVIVNKPIHTFEEVEIDEQKIDVFPSLAIDHDGHFKRIKLPRPNLYVARDVATGCVLATHLCLTTPPKQEDILTLIEKIWTKWEPLDLKTPGLFYPPTAGFPSMLGEHARRLIVGTIKLDNALAHHARAIEDVLCRRLGTTLNLGRPANPLQRASVEHQFSILNALTHRFQSTAGSSVTDPKRITSKQAKKPADVTYQQLLEFIDVHYASLNAMAQGGSHGHSPLEQVQHQLENKYLPIREFDSASSTNPFTKRFKRNINYSESGAQRPFITIKSIKFKGACLHDEALVGQKIDVEVDMRDMRKVRVFVMGKSIGELRAPMSKQNYPLSFITLSAIRKAQKKDRGLKDVAADGYFDYIFEHATTPKENLEVLRVYTEIKQGKLVHSASSTTPSAQEDQITLRHVGKKTIPPWEDLILVNSAR